MGNSSSKNTQKQIQDICKDIEPQFYNKKGQQIYKIYYERTKFPDIAIFNQYRLSPLIKKFSIDKSNKKEIREIMSEINNKSQNMFEIKWEKLAQQVNAKNK